MLGWLYSGWYENEKWQKSAKLRSIKRCTKSKKAGKEKGRKKVMATKKLSPKQMKIAAAAKPTDKITGADFKALKKKKKAGK
jgi:hypothetical protein